MSEMVERVARVLSKMDGDSAVMFDYYLEQARDVIKAVREPTDEMLNASKFAVQNKSSLRDADKAIYQAMIDAALS